MQQRVHGEDGTLRQVVGMTTPRHWLTADDLHVFRLQRMEPDADRRLLVEGTKVTLETLIAKELACGVDELGM